MRYAADADGRYPLSNPEYIALCCLMGAVNMLKKNKETLEDRLRLVKGGWRDIQLVTSVCDKLFEKILDTVPIKKLLSIQREMRYMVCETKLGSASRPQDEDDIFITNTALKKMVNRAICMDCTFCEKTKQECKKCELYRDISACYPFELGKPETETCPLAGATEL